MRRLVISVVLAVLAGTILVPAPAVALQPPLDLGGFLGTVRFGKSGTCEPDGSGDVSGPGLGMPFFITAKWGHWRIDGVVHSLLYGFGEVHLCGLLGPVGRGSTRMGAACGWDYSPAKAYGGQGRITYAHTEIQLWDVGAKYVRRTLFGRAAIDPEKSQGTFFFQKSEGDGNAECFEKWDDDKSGGEGATAWTFTAGFHITPLFSTGLSDYYDDPGTCKDSSNPACPHESKQ